MSKPKQHNRTVASHLSVRGFHRPFTFTQWEQRTWGPLRLLSQGALGALLLRCGGLHRWGLREGGVSAKGGVGRRRRGRCEMPSLAVSCDLRARSARDCLLWPRICAACGTTRGMRARLKVARARRNSTRGYALGRIFTRSTLSRAIALAGTHAYTMLLRLRPAMAASS